MVKCGPECVACCDFCIHCIHDEYETDGIKATGGPIGCSLWDDDKHQELAEMGGYCEDFHCFKVKD